MKERLLFVCVGQAGSNIGQMFEGKGYNCLFINTSNDDLETIQGKHKYHIPAATGCNKDRQKALLYARDYYDAIVNTIDKKFPLQDMVYFIFSLGGGTGSGLSPILLDILSNKNTNKSYGAVTIIPSLNESLKAQVNSVEAYKQVTDIERLKNVFILDNNKKDKFRINDEFAMLFDRLVNVTERDPRGIIDGAELEVLLTTKGNSIMTFIPHAVDMGWMLEQKVYNNIFTNYERGCKYIGLSMSNHIKMENVEELIGMPIDSFTGYSKNETFLISVGMPYPRRIIDRLLMNISMKQENLNDIQPNIEYEVPRIKSEIKPTEESAPKELSSIWKKYIN